MERFDWTLGHVEGYFWTITEKEGNFWGNELEIDMDILDIRERERADSSCVYLCGRVELIFLAATCDVFFLLADWRSAHETTILSHHVPCHVGAGCLFSCVVLLDNYVCFFGFYYEPLYQYILQIFAV